MNGQLCLPAPDYDHPPREIHATKVCYVNEIGPLGGFKRVKFRGVRINGQHGRVFVWRGPRTVFLGFSMATVKDCDEYLDPILSKRMANSSVDWRGRPIPGRERVRRDPVIRADHERIYSHNDDILPHTNQELARRMREMVDQAIMDSMRAAMADEINSYVRRFIPSTVPVFNLPITERSVRDVNRTASRVNWIGKLRVRNRGRYRGPVGDISHFIAKPGANQRRTTQPITRSCYGEPIDSITADHIRTAAGIIERQSAADREVRAVARSIADNFNQRFAEFSYTWLTQFWDRR